MKPIFVKDLMKRYLSYFTAEEKANHKVGEVVLRLVDNDMTWLTEQAKKPEPRFKPNKIIVAWSGRAYMLSKILAIGDKIK
jgi:hypothetical protein|tara:strand:- start:1373 stop:1615 length:243 start_codon:yes stop_codon:yes gene_type:complete